MLYCCCNFYAMFNSVKSHINDETLNDETLNDEMFLLVFFSRFKEGTTEAYCPAQVNDPGQMKLN